MYMSIIINKLSIGTDNILINYSILDPPLVVTPIGGDYNVPQIITLKAFSDDAIIYYSTSTLDTQIYKDSINISKTDTITAYYTYNGVKSESQTFDYNITEFGSEYTISGQSSFSINSAFNKLPVYGQQYFTKIFNLNSLQYNLRIGLYSGFYTKNSILNNIKSATDTPTLTEKETFLKKTMRCIYSNAQLGQTAININNWRRNFCVKSVDGQDVVGSPCRCYDSDVSDACLSNFKPDTYYSSKEKAVNWVLRGSTASLAQSIEGGALIAPESTPTITNLPNYIYEAVNNYYNNHINNNYWSSNGQSIITDNSNFGLCILSNRLLSLPCGIVFDDTNTGDNYLGIANYTIDLINSIKGNTKDLTHTYFINSQNYKGYSTCILPSFFTLDDKYGFDNNDSMQYKPIFGNREYNMEINTFNGIENKGIIKIPKLFMPKGNGIELLRDVYAMNDNLYKKTKADTNYTTTSSNSYYVPFTINSKPFSDMYSITNTKSNSAKLVWDNSNQEISQYWKLDDTNSKYIPAKATEVDPDLINYEFPKYNKPFNYTKSQDYKSYTDSKTINIKDMYKRNISISYQWVRFIDQITIRKYKDRLLKTNSKAAVKGYLDNLQAKIVDLHKSSSSLVSLYYPKTDLKQEQLVKILDKQIITPPPEYKYGYVAEVYEMIYK